MSPHGKGSQGRIVDDKRQLIPDIVTMGWGIAPGVLLVFQVLFCVVTSKPVQVQADCGRIDEQSGPSQGIAFLAEGTQDSRGEQDAR